VGQVELSFRREPPDRGGPSVLTVRQVVRGANRLLEGKFSNIWVEGEVTGLKVGGNGHAYFTLRDDDAALAVAMWRSSVERLRFRLRDGQSLRVFGRLGIFPKQGRFQMYADRAEPAGLGALMLELEERKAKLAGMGLFAVERKRPLPRWPRVIGVVTSAHGAAIHDILEVARRRCASRILLCPAVVQGPDAPYSIVRALARLQKQPEVDVIIVGRGGGSVEDLWAFNDEKLAHAIAACCVPVVSAVGHEVDVTIADLVADVRAATPSQAAELVVPDRIALEQRLDALHRRLARAVERQALDERSRLDQLRAQLGDLGRLLTHGSRRRVLGLQRRLQQQHPRARVSADRRRLAGLHHRLVTVGRRLPADGRAQLAALERALERCGRSLPRRARARLERVWTRLRSGGPGLSRRARLRLAEVAGKLDALSPLRVLERGYAVVSGPTGRVVTDAREVRAGDALGVRLLRGRLRAQVIETEADPSLETPEDG
jgi:exodeoxyribonuclease VII large subunit